MFLFFFMTRGTKGYRRNGGWMSSRINTEYSHHLLTPEEEQTCQSLVENVDGSRITLMPTHHISTYGSLSGFHYQCPASAPASALPISRRMFYGHTMVMCDESEETILRLLLQKQRNQELMKDFLETVERECEPALLSHAPENTGYMNVYNQQDILTKDCAHWTPEVPETIGIYHAMIRGFNREVREHKLFIVCSGCLEKACDEFCNLLIDVGDRCDAYKIGVSTEAWWLQRACRRARCHLIHKLARAFSLKTPYIEDIQAHSPRHMAIHSLDTVVDDLVFYNKTQTMGVLNGCTDTTRTTGGALVKMHPMEGYWLFRASDNNKQLNKIGVFPAQQPELANPALCVPVRAGSNKIVRLHEATEHASGISNYMCFDEEYFRVLQKMQWDRNQGIVELIPIIVGVGN